jgi:hypothetical protein
MFLVFVNEMDTGCQRDGRELCQTFAKLRIALKSLFTSEDKFERIS